MLVDGEVFVEPHTGLVMPLLGTGVVECRVT